MGALLGGGFNGVSAAVNGRNFWTGDVIQSGRGVFSFNNTPKIQADQLQSLDSQLSSGKVYDPKIKALADQIKDHLTSKKDYQEFVAEMEDGKYKISFRVETH